MGSSRPSLAPQLSLDFCVARFELEFKSLSIAVAGARLQRFDRSRAGWNRSGLDCFCSGHRVQCGGLYIRTRNTATAESNGRGVAEARVFISTIETNDELDRRH